MALRIDDGYTIHSQTSPLAKDGSQLPVVRFTYRPPLAGDLSRFRWEVQTAPTAEAWFTARCNFLAERLVSWDVLLGNTIAPITAVNLAAIPDEIFGQLIDGVCVWKPRTQEAAAGN